VLTGSWDKTVKAWDPRSAPASAEVASLDLPDRVYSSSLAGRDTLLVATAGRHMHLYDLRKLRGGSGSGSSGGGGSGALIAARESTLKHQTRCVRAFPDGAGWATASIEGRIAIEYVDAAPEVQARKYAFKCHRAKLASGEEKVFPVNALAFHPVFGTFVSGGSDGFVSCWDAQNKKRLSQFPEYATSISSLAFNRDGSLLAIAASYTFEQGEAPHPADAIHVRTVSDADVRPKAAGAAGAASAAPRP
jgi:cell cycle arrest protein BUB3